jgi:hypothetical protein
LTTDWVGQQLSQIHGRRDLFVMDVTQLRGIAATAPYFHNNSAATLEEVLDLYDAFFLRVARMVPPPNLPPILSSNGLAVDRGFVTADERAGAGVPPKAIGLQVLWKEQSRRAHMKPSMVGVLALVCGVAVATNAGAEEKKGTEAKGLTLTGCLKAGDSAGTFKLTNVTGGPASTNKEWKLMGAPASLKMADHVGHKVSVTGTIMGTGKAAKAEGQPNAREESAQRHLQVQSFTHVAATCS